MIIFGTKSTRKLLDKGTFDCPNCGQHTNFELRRARTWFHLYFIPLIPTGTHPSYVECKSCKATFVEGVLKQGTNADSQAMRAEFETAMLAILVRMAWADGKVEPEEKQAILHVVNHVCAREFSMADVEAEIEAAKTSLEDALMVSTRAGHMLNEAGKEMILEAVFQIALADGEFAQDEYDLFMEIGAGLGLRPAHVKGVFGELVEEARMASEQGSHPG